MGCRHIKYKLFSCHHQRARDLLILDLKELKTWRAPFLSVTYYLAIHKPSGKLMNVPDIALVHWHYDIRNYLFLLPRQKQCLYPHQDACKWESYGHIPVLIFFVPFSLPQLHPPQFEPPRIPVLCCGKWRLLSLIFFFLSSPMFTHCSASQLIWLWQNNAAVGGHSRTD